MFSFRIFNVIDVRLPEDLAERMLLLTTVTGQTATEIVANAARAEIVRQFNDALGTLPEDRQQAILQRVQAAELEVEKSRQQAATAAERFQQATQWIANDERASAPKARPVAERLAERAQAFLDGYRRSGAQGNWVRTELDRIFTQLGQPGVAGRIRHEGGEFSFESDVRSILGVTGYEPLTEDQIAQVRAAFKPGASSPQPRTFNVGRTLVGAR